jgi:N-acetyl-anhydromuramyl-L-alanine amidase AmpD
MGDYPYKPAHLQWPRPQGVKPTLLVIHTMEAGEYSSTAESCAAFFQRSTSTGSAHLCIDNDSIVQSVPFERKAAGARGAIYKGRTVNDWAVHFEHAGYARQTAAEWADDYSQKMLFWSAIAAAKVCKQYGIPAVALDPIHLRNGQTGITTHAAVSTAFKVVGGHTDPGPAFPMASYVAAVAYWLPHA